MRTEGRQGKAGRCPSREPLAVRSKGGRGSQVGVQMPGLRPAAGEGAAAHGLAGLGPRAHRARQMEKQKHGAPAQGLHVHTRAAGRPARLAPLKLCPKMPRLPASALPTRHCPHGIAHTQACPQVSACPNPSSPPPPPPAPLPAAQNLPNHSSDLTPARPHPCAGPPLAQRQPRCPAAGPPAPLRPHLLTGPPAKLPSSP